MSHAFFVASLVLFLLTKGFFKHFLPLLLYTWNLRLIPFLILCIYSNFWFTKYWKNGHYNFPIRFTNKENIIQLNFTIEPSCRNKSWGMDKIQAKYLVWFRAWSYTSIMNKVVLIWEPAPTPIFKLSPTNMNFEMQILQERGN